jgi:hypothetical protein
MTNTFFTTIVQDLSLYRRLFYSAAVYRTLTKSNWWRVLGFFLLAHIAIALLATSSFYLRFLPQALQDSAEIIIILRQHLPRDLVFSWNTKNQELTFVETEENQLPVQVPSAALVSLESVSTAGVTSLPKYFLTIQKQAEDTTDSLIVLDSQGASIHRANTDSTSKIEYSLFPQFQDSFEVTGEFVIAYLEQTVDRLTSMAYQAWPLALLLAVPIMIILTSLTLFLDLFFIILLVKLNQYRLSVSESIKLTLLVGGVAALMSQIVATIYTNVQLPIYTMTFWLIVSYLFLFNSRLWR